MQSDISWETVTYTLSPSLNALGAKEEKNSSILITLG